MSKAAWVAGALIVASASATGVYLSQGKKVGPKFRKERVEKGDVTSLVAASGTLSAVTTVKVGSQVSGIIYRLYVDFNAEVRKGQKLAELDPTPFQASVEQRRADLEKARVDLRNSELAFARASSLQKQQLVSQAEYDTAKANRDGSAASVAQSEAALKQAMTNLNYTQILSPIDGVVVDRQYDVGQTVAASFQAPTLFTIAQDLTKMQVLTNIDEADVGKIQTGMKATFTVDAFPDRVFSGSVFQVRLSPQIVQNVVTYPVLLDVANLKGELKPGMTANVQVPVQKETDKLKVPNAALRFRPADSDVSERENKKGVGQAGKSDASSASAPARGSASGSTGQKSGGEGRRQSGEGRRQAGEGKRPGGASREAGVYVEGADGKLRRISVKPLLTDGNFTAVESEGLKESDEIVVGLATARALELGGRSPSGGPPRGGMRF